MQRILVVNGPNLNLLGEREPEVYGSTTLAELEAKVVTWGAKLGCEVTTFQSNHEGALIDLLHDARSDVDGLVLNLGAFTHSSYALHDAIVATDVPAVEVHISNVMRREPWRRTSVVAPACLYGIYGRGIIGYRDALRLLKIRTSSPVEAIGYGSSPEQIIDVRRPRGPGPHPTAILLHGGFWRSEWTRDTIDGLAADLTARGWIAANAEYRRLDVGGAWPQTRDDVKRAIDAVRALPGVDPSRLVLVGHSAGSHLALHLAQEAAAQAVVGLASVTNVTQAHETGVGDDSVARFMGGAPADVPAAYNAATTPEHPARVLLVHGATDHLVPVEQSRHYAERHPAAELVELDDAGHFELLDPAREPWQRVLAWLPA